MPNVYRSAQAERDLDEIWDYLAARNLDAAERFLDQLEALANLLVAQPGLGRVQDELAVGLRVMPLRDFHYLIYYQATKDGIIVVRVLHGARDIPALFENEDDD